MMIYFIERSIRKYPNKNLCRRLSIRWRCSSNKEKRHPQTRIRYLQDKVNGINARNLPVAKQTVICARGMGLTPKITTIVWSQHKPKSHVLSYVIAVLFQSKYNFLKILRSKSTYGDFSAIYCIYYKFFLWGDFIIIK